MPGDQAAVAAGVDTSCKTAFIMRLLAELVAKGHRTLIFSQSRVMLDILQAAIIQQSYQFRRIDGSISSATERQVSHSCSPETQLKEHVQHAYPPGKYYPPDKYHHPGKYCCLSSIMPGSPC